jgi:hypothetical protein
MFIDRQFRLARLWSNGELRKLAPFFSGDIANVSGGDNIDKEGGTYDTYFPNCENWYVTNYLPGSFRGFAGRENEFLVDLTKELDPKLVRRFDVVMNHTTLEHIFDVNAAFHNLCQMTRDIAIIVVPFCQVQHESSAFGDYWRFTPTCLRQLFQNNGLQVIYESESPHENAAVYLLMAASRYPEIWRNKMPTWSPVQKAGQWIGRSRPTLLQRITARISRLLPDKAKAP